MDEASLYLQATTMAVWGPRGQPVTVRSDPAVLRDCLKRSLRRDAPEHEAGHGQVDHGFTMLIFPS